MSFSKDLPIGLFDSGAGGLTVMRELISQLPNENMIYLGDTARLPYGTKSPESIQKFSFENANFLLQHQIKLLIIACHTACSHAFHILQSELPIPVLGVVEPAVYELLKTCKNSRAAILGTPSTIASNRIQSLLREKSPSFETVSIACPLFVPLVEEGLHDHPATKLIAQNYLSVLQNISLDAVLLACTHYPLLAHVIQDVIQSEIKIIDPAYQTAQQAKQFLLQKGLLNPTQDPPSYKFYVTDAPDKFRSLAKIFFPFSMPHVFLASK